VVAAGKDASAEAGWAHAGVAVEHAVETRTVTTRAIVPKSEVEKRFRDI
jgi:hypothetical protein